MNVTSFKEILNCDFFAGVPDSLLKPLCDYLYSCYGISEHHIIAANEGNAVAIAAGYHMATGKVPCVYMQNSGQGNVVNPVASLLNDKVYAIPCIFVIGWRGEPGVKDEPQHIYQGEVTLKLLEDMDIAYFVLDSQTTEQQMKTQMEIFQTVLAEGKSVAFVVKKNALENDGEKVTYSNEFKMTREEIIEEITKVSGEDIIVSTTGKASRELFEIREKNKQPHQYDFLTVGSMGHTSSIALGIALNKKEATVWCVDGDGSMLMHMGSLCVVASNQPSNMIYIVINNNSHETVGGIPTVSHNLDLLKIAEGCGFQHTYSVSDKADLKSVLQQAKNNNELTFVEIKCSIGARADLGRPTTTARQNKEIFMDYLRSIKE